MKIRHVGTILFSLLAIESALAEVGVFDFEDDAQVAAWRIRSAGQDTLRSRTRGETISAYAAFPEGIDVDQMATEGEQGHEIPHDHTEVVGGVS
jgi:hypothetical protein